VLSGKTRIAADDFGAPGILAGYERGRRMQWRPGTCRSWRADLYPGKGAYALLVYFDFYTL